MMFDFEKLIVYQKARTINSKIQVLLQQNSPSSFLRDQLYRASLSMVINIAEGTGKLSKKDKKNFYVISRGSVFECASLLDILSDEGVVKVKQSIELKKELEEVSRMLSSFINNLST